MTEEFVHEWYGAFRRRQALIVEKSRRIFVSWMSRGLETWVMGLERGSWRIIDQTHENAAEHLWRVHFSLTELYDRRPELNLRRHDWRGSVVTKEPTDIILSNGSLMTQGHQDAGAAQGKGMTGVTLEEISKYRHPSEFWAQAKIVTQGSDGTGGWVLGIANASPNEDWKSIKGADVDHNIPGIKARKLLGLE